MKARQNRPEKKLKIVVPGDLKKISTLDLIKKAVLDYLDRKKQGKKSPISKNGFVPDMNSMRDITFMAIVIDNEVMDIMRAQPRLASMLAAKPTFVPFDPNEYQVQLGDIYEDGKLKPKTPLLNPTEFSLSKETKDEA